MEKKTIRVAEVMGQEEVIDADGQSCQYLRAFIINVICILSAPSALYEYSVQTSTCSWKCRYNSQDASLQDPRWVKPSPVTHGPDLLWQGLGVRQMISECPPQMGTSILRTDLEMQLGTMSAIKEKCRCAKFLTRGSSDFKAPYGRQLLGA